MVESTRPTIGILPRLCIAVALAIVFDHVSAQARPITQPSWSELTQSEQQILMPLAGEWNSLEAWRRKKWLDIAHRFPRLREEEKARIVGQMHSWTRLSPEQRAAARAKYNNVRKASPQERDALKALWSEYQALPAEQRQQLNEAAVNKPGARPKAPRPPATVKSGTVPVAGTIIPRY